MTADDVGVAKRDRMGATSAGFGDAAVVSLELSVELSLLVRAGDFGVVADARVGV